MEENSNYQNSKISGIETIKRENIEIIKLVYSK
jgi:hypothetical protein